MEWNGKEDATVFFNSIYHILSEYRRCILFLHLLNGKYDNWVVLDRRGRIQQSMTLRMSNAKNAVTDVRTVPGTGM